MDKNKRYKQGYSIFGSDGSLQQIEYAKKSVSNSEPSIGIQVDDGIVLLSQNTSVKSPLLINDSIEKIHKIDDSICMVMSGHTTDGRILAEKLREYATEEKSQFGEISDTSILVHNIAENIQETIQSTELRPYGVSLIIGGISYDDKPELYKIDPSGKTSAWKGVAIGQNHNEILKYIENEYNSKMNIKEAIDLAIKSLINSTENDIESELIDITTIKTNGLCEKQTNDVINKVIKKVKNNEK